MRETRLKRALVASLVLTVSLAGCSAMGGSFGRWQDVPRTDIPQSSTLFDARFESAGQSALDAIADHRTEHGFPAITAAVAIRGELVWSGAAGWRDLESRLPADNETVLRVGSTSKAITATVLARMIDAGEITLETPLGEIAQWPNAAWNALTPRQLTSHTAGFAEYENNTDRAGQYVTLCGCRHYESVRESLGIFDDANMLYAPGTQFAYSSFDVNLMGAALAEVNSTSFLQAIEEHVLTPLDLSSTGGDAYGVVRPTRATFYEIDGERAREWRPFDLSQRWPGGGLVSTSEELVVIGSAWMNDDFISPETRAAMWEPQTLADGTANAQSYAHGWRYNADVRHPADPERTTDIAHHGGVTKGAMSWLIVYPEYDMSVAVNINTRADTFQVFAAVEDEIAAAFLNALEAQP